MAVPGFSLPNITPANRLASEQATRGSFPHMSPADSEVWRRFISLSPVRFDSIRYDVALGGSQADLVPPGEELLPMWQQLLKKRIDVVARILSTYWIIEVKPIANMAALGQILAYDFLYRRDSSGLVKTRKVVVCGALDSDLPGVYESFDVTVFVSAVDSSGVAERPRMVVSPVSAI